MKKKCIKFIILALAIIFSINSMHAQKVYFTLNPLGYNMQLGSHNINNFNNRTDLVASIEEEKINVSLGKGLNFGLATGIMINEDISVQIEFSYLLGGKTEAEIIGINSKEVITIYSRMFRINPSIVVASGFDWIDPYARFGFVMGVGSIIKETDASASGVLIYEKEKYNGGIALGFNAGAGIMYTINESILFFNENFQLFAEFNIINMSYAPTKSEVIEATEDGTNILPNLTIREKETEYVDSYKYEYANPPSDTKPDKDLKYKFPFGSIGFNIGARFSF